MQRPLLIMVLVAVCACISAPTIFAQNPLTNGSFETGDFTGWTTGGNFQFTQVVSGANYAYSGAQDGNFYVTMGPVSSDGTLSQTLATTSGVQYTISFWFASVGDSPSDFSVYWNNTQLLSLSNPNTGATWTHFTFTVTATGSDTLLFSFRDDPAYMALDNVSVISSMSNYACPAAQTGFREIHDFGVLTTDDTPSGVAIDSGGNLYGTLATAGRYGAGELYGLAQRAGNWFVSSLYNFLGGSNGSSPGGVMAGPEGAFYGGASGGIQNCGIKGSSYCGLIYKATPPPNACSNALCSWKETTIYQFTSNEDAWGGTVSAFDSVGNLYGYGANAVFELSPSQGVWTEKILYRFSGGSDGSVPSSLLLGHDGNLYGTTVLGGNNNCDYGGPCGVVFQLVPSGNGWTENVLYAFSGTTDGGWPGGLVQDGSGNLYGFSVCSTVYDYWDCGQFYYEEYGLIFKLTPSAGGWEFAVIHNALNDCGTAKTTFHALTIDAAGTLFAAEGGVDQGVGELFNCGRILDVTTGTFPVGGAADIFYNLTSDANGNLYGTTSTCGFGNTQRTTGMIWQYSP